MERAGVRSPEGDSCKRIGQDLHEKKVCVYVRCMTRGCVRLGRCAWSGITQASPLLIVLKARVVRGPHAQNPRAVVILLWSLLYKAFPLPPSSSFTEFPQSLPPIFFLWVI
jgi:hypothetical protein